MNKKLEIRRNNYFLEKIKWLIIAVILISSIFINVFFNSLNCFKNIITVVFIIIAIVVASMTNKGKLVTSFFKEAKIELSKVIWPTFQETFYTTLIISLVSILVSLALWGMDNILVRIVSFIINLRL